MNNLKKCYALNTNPNSCINAFVCSLSFVVVHIVICNPVGIVILSGWISGKISYDFNPKE
jgi:hypothetical protein